mmetsp:Transcript_30834/g.73527  ORF Transcript_30834/g.73527 Transcript_30834/m.73527 type:complete len:236 (-) Transcript_30834:96-803(-)
MHCTVACGSALANCQWTESLLLPLALGMPPLCHPLYAKMSGRTLNSCPKQAWLNWHMLQLLGRLGVPQQRRQLCLRLVGLGFGVLCVLHGLERELHGPRHAPGAQRLGEVSAALREGRLRGHAEQRLAHLRAVGGHGARFAGVRKGPWHLQADAQLRRLLGVHRLISEAWADDHGHPRGQRLREAVLAAVREEEVDPSLEKIHLGHRSSAQGVGRHLKPLQGIRLWAHGNHEQRF